MALDKFNLSFKEKICKQNLIDHEEKGYFAINIGYFMALKGCFLGKFLLLYAQNATMKRKKPFKKW